MGAAAENTSCTWSHEGFHHTLIHCWCAGLGVIVTTINERNQSGDMHQRFPFVFFSVRARVFATRNNSKRQGATRKCKGLSPFLLYERALFLHMARQGGAWTRQCFLALSSFRARSVCVHGLAWSWHIVCVQGSVWLSLRGKRVIDQVTCTACSLPCSFLCERECLQQGAQGKGRRIHERASPSRSFLLMNKRKRWGCLSLSWIMKLRDDTVEWTGNTSSVCCAFTRRCRGIGMTGHQRISWVAPWVTQSSSTRNETRGNSGFVHVFSHEGVFACGWKNWRLDGGTRERVTRNGTERPQVDGSGQEGHGVCWSGHTHHDQG